MTLRHWEDTNTHTHTHRQRRVFKFKLNYSWTDHFRPELSEQTSVAPGLPFYLRTNNMHLCSVSLLIGHIDLFVFPHWWEWFAFLFVLQELREEAPSTSRAIKTTQLDPVSVETRRIDTSGSWTCQESFHYDPQEIPGSPGSPVFNGFFFQVHPVTPMVTLSDVSVMKLWWTVMEDRTAMFVWLTEVLFW